MENYKFNSNKILLFIPIVMFILSIIFDFGLVFVSNKRLNSMVKDVFNTVSTYEVKNYKGTLADELNKKGIDYVTFDYLEGEDFIEVLVVYYEPSFSGRLIGIKNYEIKSHLKVDVSKTPVEITELDE